MRSSVTRLSHLLRSLGCDILHTHLPRDYFLAAVATLGTTVVNVGTRHQLYPLSHAFLKRPFLKRFSGFIAVSEAVRKGLLQAGVVSAEQLSVVHHGLELPLETTLDRAVAGRLRLLTGAIGDVQLIGLVGRLCPSKGMETVIEAMIGLKDRWPRLKVVMVGEESPGSGYRAYLQDKIDRLGLGGRVVLAGYVEQAGELSGFFDIQVVPSAAEPFGLVTLEAMASGVPVVVTAAGGSPEIIRDGVEGFLFAPGDAAALARKLDCLLDSPGLCRAMGQLGRQRVVEVFSREEMLDRTEAVYRRALKYSSKHSEPAGRKASA